MTICSAVHPSCTEWAPCLLWRNHSVSETVLHSAWRIYLTQPPQQWVCPYLVFPLAQRPFYSLLKRSVLSLSYPKAQRVCLTLKMVLPLDILYWLTAQKLSYPFLKLTSAIDPLHWEKVFHPEQRIHQLKSCLTLMWTLVVLLSQCPVCPFLQALYVRFPLLLNTVSCQELHSPLCSQEKRFKYTPLITYTPSSHGDLRADWTLQWLWSACWPQRRKQWK